MKKRNNRGFSLVELLVAVVILGLVVVPLLHAFFTAALTSGKSRQAGAATIAAQNAVETIQANSVAAILQGKPETVATLFGAESAAWDEGHHSLTLTNVSTGDQKFDLQVLLDATKYEAVNEKPITQFAAMDAIYTQDSEGVDPDSEAESSFSTSHPDADITGRSRTATIRLMRVDGDEGKKQIQVSVRFTYRFEYEEMRLEDGVEDVYYGRATESSNLVTLLPGDYQIGEEDSLSVYFFFAPYYQGSPTDDVIEIENPSNQPCKIFLVKQKTGSSAAGEGTYSAKVNLREKHANDADPFAADVFSNVGVNLNGSGTCNYQYKKYDGAYFESGTFTGELVERLPEDRLYDVQVEVYPAGAAESVLTLQAAKLQ